MTCWNNSCETCVAASDEGRCNGYLDLQCNIKRLVDTPFDKRDQLMSNPNANRMEIEAQYSCKYYCSKVDYIKLMEAISDL